MRKAAAFITVLISIISFTVISFAQTDQSKAALKALRESESKIEIIRGYITSMDKQKNQIEIKESKTDEKKTIGVNSKRLTYLKIGDEVKVILKSEGDAARSVRVITRGKTIIPESKK